MRVFRLFTCLCIIFTLIFVYAFSICFAEQNAYVWSNNAKSLSDENITDSTQTNSEISNDNFLNLE